MQALRKQESPEERAIRNEANMKYMQNVRMNESLEDKAARNKKRMEAWRNKIMNETKEEMADRKRKNMLYQRQYRQHNTGLNSKRRSAKRALVLERATKAQRVKVHYINGLLLEKVGISIHDMRVTACIYGNPQSLLSKKKKQNWYDSFANLNYGLGNTHFLTGEETFDACNKDMWEKGRTTSILSFSSLEIAICMFESQPWPNIRVGQHVGLKTSPKKKASTAKTVRGEYFQIENYYFF